MRIALYGGSFNPPHLGHQLACTVVLAAGADQVWMVPAYQHAFDKPLAPFEDRHSMCVRAARLFGGHVLVSRVEAELGGASYTLRTVQALKARHPEHELSLVIGADLVAERHHWHGWDELSELVSFLVIGREGVASDPDDAHARDTHLPIELPPVSSTDARRRLATRASTAGVLDVEVRAYIDDAGLYAP